MKTLEIILKGGMQTCCSTYSAEDIKGYTEIWFKEIPDIKYDVIDIEDNEYDVGLLADLAYKHFGDTAFPMVYFNKKLISIAGFPEKQDCLKIIENPVPLTEEEIEERARMYKEQQEK